MISATTTRAGTESHDKDTEGAMQLTQQQLADYRRDGIVFLPALFG